ncbi:DUF1488 family protein [Shewanella surugensis]|uniref:DUF1488 domain-containing protein n=1 Tax=Shewanella surugensis TaxID=212020 RepID=A0ABT0LH20_9GAMM|nr:DUF1488 family protein [Shewanella surugensis]MCL1126994.1 DUF1488 domain-containing protein [Shewanella surugensis]
MNQSVLFPDLQEWNAQVFCIDFPAQVQGANIECRVTLKTLLRISVSLLDRKDLEVAVKALALFDEYRFDIEEEIEVLIEQEAFDEQGRINL